MDNWFKMEWNVEMVILRYWSRKLENKPKQYCQKDEICLEI